MALILDGHSAVGSQAGTALPITLTNSRPNAQIFVAADVPGPGVTSVTDNSGQGLVWTVRSPTVTGSLEEWTTFSPIPFSGVTITVNIGSAGFNGLVAWAVAGQKAFDGSPVAGFPPPPMQISTTNPYCLIFAAARFTATADPIIGPGWSLVDSPAGGFLSVEYQIVSAPQTNLVGAFTSTDLGAEFMDALTTDPPGLAGPDFTQSPILQVRNPAFIY